MKKYIRRVLVLTLAALLVLSSAQALTLRYNQRGEEVKALQSALYQLGYYSKSLDGVYGSGTRAAVRDFQKANGLSVDGVAGPATLGKIEALTGIDIGGGSSSGGTGGAGGNTGSGNSGSGSTEAPSTGKGLFGGVYTTLQYGSSGSRVRTLQQALKALGYEVGKVDGSFGSVTYAAVREFQRSEKLAVDGKAGKQTLKKLESYFDEDGNLLGGSGDSGATTPPVEDDGPDYAIPTRTLRYGMTGDDVKYTQQRLKELKYYTGTVDGVFATAMRTAVRAFQAKHDLDVDGVIGPATRKLLFSDDALAADETVFRTLKLGMEGEDVGRLQLRLKALGYYAGTADGIFDTDTLIAVAEFQLANSLTTNGVCDEKTWNKAFSSNAIPKEEEDEEEEDPAPVIPDDTLEVGETGEEVKSLQVRLKELGYYTGAVDGEFAGSTYTAVKAFQKRNGLNVDGKAGKYTLAALYSDDAIPAEDEVTQPDEVILPDRILRKGMSGEDVKSVQARLKELGYYKGDLDGEFDQTTLLAVRAFQQNNNLVVDGAAGPNTNKLLFSEKAISAPADTTIIPTRNLTIGDTGDDVKAVQQRLRNLGFYTSQVDGTYGGSTTSAMFHFQEMNGLPATGNGDLATYARLFSDDALNDEGVLWGTEGPDYTNLKTGSTGAAVTRLQQKLRELKYDVTVNGTYDAQTKAAVIKFQKLNGLSADGIAGKATQTRLYSGNPVTGDNEVPEDSGDHGEGVVPTVPTGNGGGPDPSQVKWLMWIDEIKPQLGSADILLVYEPKSNTSYRIRVYARGKHLDAEPYTIQDTALMKAAWGGEFAWDEKPVYVRLPSGVWCIASTHSMPHEENGITTNGFYGHLCVHFPRTMEETILAGDTKNGVRHQNDIRKHWLELTGENITW